jgi:hypothetical protein
MQLRPLLALSFMLLGISAVVRKPVTCCAIPRQTSNHGATTPTASAVLPLAGADVEILLSDIADLANTFSHHVWGFAAAGRRS